MMAVSGCSASVLEQIGEQLAILVTLGRERELSLSLVLYFWSTEPQVVATHSLAPTSSESASP